MASMVALSAAGCGSGGSPTGTPTPRPGQLRDAFLHTVIPDLVKEGVPRAKVACVERNIEDLPETAIAERIVEAAPAEVVEHGTEVEKLGRFGRGCF
jgi:hypothetical protein